MAAKHQDGRALTLVTLTFVALSLGLLGCPAAGSDVADHPDLGPGDPERWLLDV